MPSSAKGLHIVTFTCLPYCLRTAGASVVVVSIRDAKRTNVMTERVRLIDILLNLNIHYFSMNLLKHYGIAIDHQVMPSSFLCITTTRPVLSCKRNAPCLKDTFIIEAATGDISVALP